MLMKPALVLSMTSVTLFAVLTGCSTSTESHGPATTSAPMTATTQSAAPSADGAPTAAEPGTGRVTLENAELGAVTGVSCQTEGGVTTITIGSTPKTTIVLTEGADHAVKSVNIGELGADGPSMAYVEGVMGTAARATRDGNSYTVTGTGTGAEAADPATPVDLPFEIAATCP